MPRQPLSRERICDALESCRPGSGDLFTPELADVADHVAVSPEWENFYERIQQNDLKISVAFHDVEIPPGLEQRLVAAIELDRAENAISTALKGNAEIDSPTVSPAASNPEKARAFSRRWLMAAGGMLTAAAILFLVVFLGMNNTGGYSKQTVLNEAIGFFETDTPAVPGQLLDRTPAPSQYPFSKAICSFRGIRWRAVKNFLGQSGVAFDLPAPGGGRATLYVVDRKLADLDAMPTSNPSNTGGCCVAAWQEDGLVYVLVVQGSQKSYQEYLNLPRGPIA